MSKLRVAMLATPWLPVPPNGYGGTELVVHGLTRQLLRMGVKVDLFTIGSSRVPGAKLHSLYQQEQYSHIHKPFYEASPISIAHQLEALEYIRKNGRFDIIHDHNPFIGPLALRWATELRDMPPAVHTHHGPPFSSLDLTSAVPDNMPMWQRLGASKRLFYVGISNALMKPAPRQLKPQILPAVHNAINVQQFPYVEKKKKYFITLGRFTRDKGQHTAARLCHKLGYRLQMAGNVAGINSPSRLLLALANPLSEYRSFADFKYYRDFVWPISIKDPRIKYVGNIGGERKLKFISEARALLFPIDWEEPFGMAPIEALACGTPVVAMRRGALPEIIEHGVNGFLADTVYEFQEYMQRVDEIDPRACRETVKEKFSLPQMAQGYLDRYEEVLRRTKSR